MVNGYGFKGSNSTILSFESFSVGSTPKAKNLLPEEALFPTNQMK